MRRCARCSSCLASAVRVILACEPRCPVAERAALMPSFLELVCTVFGAGNAPCCAVSCSSLCCCLFMCVGAVHGRVRPHRLCLGSLRLPPSSSKAWHMRMVLLTQGLRMKRDHLWVPPLAPTPTIALTNSEAPPRVPLFTNPSRPCQTPSDVGLVHCSLVAGYTLAVTAYARMSMCLTG